MDSAKLFSRFFRQATGISPQKYRREIQHLVSKPGPAPRAVGEPTGPEAATPFTKFAPVKRPRSSA